MTIKEDIKHIKNMANAIRYGNGGKSYYEIYKDLSVADLLLVLQDENYHSEETIIEALVSLDYWSIKEAIDIASEHFKKEELTPELSERRSKLVKTLRERK
jgi:predicted RNase H-related nuclease YkuK (DUF458 family)